MRINRFLKLMLLGFCFLSAIPAAVFAQATVIEIAGKVEVKAPNAGWGPAWVGMWIPQGSIISTGFNAKAVVQLDNSTLYIKQLTRLTLEEISRQQGVIKTNLYIRTGSLEADVKTGEGEGFTHDFKVRSPVATAAVRGTIIKWNGAELLVKKGRATLFNLLGQPTTVFMGDSAETTDGLDLLTSKILFELRTKIYLYLRKPGRLYNPGSQVKDWNGSVVIFEFDWDAIF